jgi:hypothetical protein
MHFQDLGATGIIGIVIVAFAVIGFFKGLIRTALAMVCLGIAGYTALWGHEHATDLTGPWINNPGPWAPKAIAVVTGLLVFFICRYLLNFLVDPFNRSSTGKRIGFGLPAALLSLCSGLAIIWFSFTGIRYSGSLAELRDTRLQILNDDSSGASSYTTPLLLQAKHSLDASSVGQWHLRTDPFYTPGKLTLCQVLVIYHHPQTREKLLKDPALNRLVNHPEFLELAYRKNIKHHAVSGQPRALFAAAPITRTLAHPDFAQLLQKIDLTYLASLATHPAQ